MTDTRTTVDIAMGLMEGEWMPSHIAETMRCEADPERLVDSIEEDMPHIAWAASSWLWSKGWQSGSPYALDRRHHTWRLGIDVEIVRHPDPIRATLLAAEAAMKGDADG